MAENASVLTGLANSFAITPASNVSSDPYTLSVVGALSNANYTINQRNTGVWPVAPATLTYEANFVTRISGADYPALTGTVTGFVLSDTQANATSGTLVFGSGALPTTLPGAYAILGSGLASNNGNYIFVQAPGNASALLVTTDIILNQSPRYLLETLKRSCDGSLELQVSLDTPAPPEIPKLATAPRMDPAQLYLVSPVECP
jgi:hypothetical protein